MFSYCEYMYLFSFIITLLIVWLSCTLCSDNGCTVSWVIYLEKNAVGFQKGSDRELPDSKTV